MLTETRMGWQKASLVVACFLVGIFASGSLYAQTESDSTLTVSTSWRFLSGLQKEIHVGGSEKPLFSLGMFPSRAPAVFLARRSTEASDLYLKYRAKRISSGILAAGGGVVVMVGLFSGGLVNYDSEDGNEGMGLIIGGTVVVLAALVLQKFGDRNLSESVRRYNKTFTDELQ
jgi:hypothetical protein